MLPAAYKRNLLLLVTAMLLTGQVYAEIIVGRVVDAKTGTPLASAIIRMTVENRKINSASTYTQNYEVDSLGCFCVYGSEGINTLAFNFIGYREVSKSVICSGQTNDTIRMGDIRLKLSDVLLKGAAVKAKRKLFYMRGDTVVYDPKAFNLKQGDRIERLLKKMPGVTLEQDGRLLWMGKPITMIMNGEYNNVAAGFLPKISVEAVDRIAVYEKKSEEERKYGLEGEKVLDVKIKREWMEKWYGNASLQAEEGRHYNMNASGFHLSDSWPTNVYANIGDGGHIFRPGSGRSEGDLKKEKSKEMRQQLIGLNTEHRQYKQGADIQHYKTYSVTYNPSIEHLDDSRKSYYNSESYLDDNNSIYSANSSSYNNHHVSVAPLNLNGYLSNAKIGFSYSFNIEYAKDETNQSSRSVGLNALPYSITSTPLLHINDADSTGEALREIASYSGRWQSSRDNDQIRLNPNVGFSIKLNERSSLNTSLSLNYDRDNERSYSISNSQHYTNSALYSIDKQHTTNPSHTTNVQFFSAYRLSLTNPHIFKRNKHKVSMSVSYNFDFKDNNSDYKLYRWLTNDFAEDSPMLSLRYLPKSLAAIDSALDRNNSVYSDLQTASQQVSLSFWWEFRNISASISSYVKAMNERLDYRHGLTDTIAKRKTALPTYSLDLKYDVSSNTTIKLSGRTQISLPRLSDKLRYIDNSSQTYIRMGNPSLKMKRSESVTLDFSSIVTKWQWMMNGSLTYTKNHRDQSSFITRDAHSGISVSMPKNIRGGHTWRLSYSAEMLFASRWRVKNLFDANFNKSYSYLIDVVTSSTVTSEPTSSNLIGSGSVDNAQKGRTLTDELQILYSGVDFDATLHAAASNRHWSNSRGANASYNYWDYNVGLKAKYRFLNEFECEMDARVDGKDGYMSSIMNRTKVLLDASLSWLLFRGRGKLTIGADDIFNQDTNNEFHVTPSSRYERRSSSIHHYYYVRFAFNFDGRKQKSGQR